MHLFILLQKSYFWGVGGDPKSIDVNSPEENRATDYSKEIIQKGNITFSGV